MCSHVKRARLIVCGTSTGASRYWSEMGRSIRLRVGFGHVHRALFHVKRGGAAAVHEGRNSPRARHTSSEAASTIGRGSGRSVSVPFAAAVRAKPLFHVKQCLTERTNSGAATKISALVRRYCCYRSIRWTWD